MAISAAQEMGGVGKSEMARKVARDMAVEFPDRQILVDLLGTTQPRSTSDPPLTGRRLPAQLGRVIGGLGDCLDGLGQMADALASTAEAIEALRPTFLRRPQAVMDRMVWIRRMHMQRCCRLGVEPDGALLGRIDEVLERLEARDDRA